MGPRSNSEPKGQKDIGMLKRKNPNILNVSFRQMMGLVLSVALYPSGEMAVAQSAPRSGRNNVQTSALTSYYGYFYIRQRCQAEDGEYYHYSFITNIFASSSKKDDGRVRNEAQAAFFAMTQAEGWTCYNEGSSELYRQDASLTSVQQARNATIRYESSAHVSLYEYNYSDGAQAGSLPSLLHQEE